jgi:GDPmannose 4,6-dehydratase
MEILITGSGGQDGTYLRRLFEEAGARVTGVDRSFALAGRGFDLTDPRDVEDLVAGTAFDEVYYLAAHQASSEATADEGQLAQSFAVNHDGAVNFLEAIRRRSRATRFFYAASAHVYGKSDGRPLSEGSPMRPICLYGKTKLLTLETLDTYRRRHGVFAAGGILFNHESALRKPGFLSRKVIEAALEIRAGRREPLVVGDLEQLVDLGYAPDYVTAFPAILRLPRPDDFVVSSGELHSVRELVDVVFAALGLDYRSHVEVRPAVLAGGRRGVLFGDNRKLIQQTSWRPRHGFRTWVELLIRELATAQEKP